MKSRSEIAVDLFNSGFNCAQSVLISFCESYGLDKETALKMACGMGGGFHFGEICGIASGAVLVIGLKYGQSDLDNKDSKNQCYSKTMEFLDMFKANNKSLACRDILDYDPSSKEGIKKSKKDPSTICSQMIFDAVNLLEELGY